MASLTTYNAELAKHAENNSDLRVLRFLRWMLWSGDFPAVAAEGIHQLDRALDELGGLVDFFHRLAAVGTGNDDAIAPRQSVVTDLIAELLAVAIEKPDHSDQQRYNKPGRDRNGTIVPFEFFVRIVASVRSQAFVSCSRPGARRVYRGAEQSSFGVQNHLDRHAFDHSLERFLRVECAHE